ncbi:MAG: DUF1573 domain-containing protein [Prevotellaceae bacterium]|jgi:hypothetical protein|nr:DUF1573 domain-containing protein [Prevotellaceae bacterium]
MKKTVSLLVFVAMAVCANAQAVIEFAKTKHDFGSIKETGGDVSHVFTFKNTGQTPLVINNVETSCGCTSPAWTKEPVQPGKSGTVTATFNPSGRPGFFEKKLTVKTNASEIPLTISGNVEAKVLTVEEQYPFAIDKLRMKSGTLEMYRVPAMGNKTENLEFINTGTTPIVVNFENVPEHISLVAEPVSIPAGTKGTVKCTYNALKKKDFGTTVDEITVRVKDSKNTLKIRANIEEDFSKLTPAELEKAPVLKADNTNYKFNTIKKGSKVTGKFEITNEGKTDLIIRKISSECNCIKATVGDMSIKPGKTTVLQLELTANETGSKFYATTIITNAPKQRETVFYMNGTVE